MFSGVLPTIRLASLPTASAAEVLTLSATTEGSLTTTPLPGAKTQVLAVPRSIARSVANMCAPRGATSTANAVPRLARRDARGNAWKAERFAAELANERVARNYDLDARA